MLKLFPLRRHLGLVRRGTEPNLQESPQLSAECNSYKQGLYDAILLALTKARAIISDWGGQLVFLKAPHWEHLVDEEQCALTDYSGIPYSDYLGLESDISSRGIWFIDGLDLFPQKEKNAQKYFSNSRSNHFSALGYRIMGQNLAKFLKKEVLF